MRCRRSTSRLLNFLAGGLSLTRRAARTVTMWWRTGCAEVRCLVYAALSAGEEFCSGGQLCQRLGQDQRAPCNIFWRSVFIGPMAVTIAAGNEEHPRRCDPRNEKGIVVSPANHFEKLKSVPAAGIGERFAHVGSTMRRRIRVN